MVERQLRELKLRAPRLTRKPSSHPDPSKYPSRTTATAKGSRPRSARRVSTDRSLCRRIGSRPQPAAPSARSARSGRSRSGAPNSGAAEDQTRRSRRRRERPPRSRGCSACTRQPGRPPPPPKAAARQRSKPSETAARPRSLPIQLATLRRMLDGQAQKDPCRRKHARHSDTRDPGNHARPASPRCPARGRRLHRSERRKTPPSSPRTPRGRTPTSATGRGSPRNRVRASRRASADSASAWRARPTPRLGVQRSLGSATATLLSIA